MPERLHSELLPSGISRRSFCQTAIASAGVAATSQLLLHPTPTLAAKPPQRNGQSHMKLSLAAYSFRNSLKHRFRVSKRRPSMTLFDFIDYCAEINLDGCELTGYYFPEEITHEYLMKIKGKTFRLGLDISGTAIGNNFAMRAGKRRDEQLKMCRDWIDYAATMGAPVIRIFAGYARGKVKEEEAIELCVAGINESLEYAAKKGVCLALENHGGITSTPEQLLKIINKVKPSPWFGVNLDGGNFRTDDPYRDLEKIAPYAINMQVKVAIQRGSRKGKKEEVDIPRLIKIMKDAHYRGYIVLEYEENEEPKKKIPKYIKQLRDAIHA
ncbi:FIG00908879: hypothetical protein [hydrothermal vent metagenome]|uniref:Xylose isomerase-like TIM barrel domain-containing protein n=1 Tax=hydrothermal vent metagenome TaxID=652676 RepID=A0A3B1E8X3_9ZZZZ